MAEKPDSPGEQSVSGAPARGSTRRVIGEVVNDPRVRERIEEMLNNALELNALAWGHCPKCKQRMQVEIPDIKGRVDALIKLIEQAEGKPQDAEAGGVSLVVEFVTPEPEPLEAA